MHEWYCVSLGDGVLAFEPKEALRAQFAASFPPPGPPAGAAVFTRHELEGRLQCEVIAYFSPAAAALARAAGARPCERPGTEDLDLLAGDPACWAALFPDAA
jgi:hypothetical protein